MNILIIVGIFLLGIFGTTLGISSTRGDTFSKVEVFETKQEYIEFKRDIADANVERMDIEILASEPPIIVDYTITLPRGEKFRDAKSTTEIIDGKEWIFMMIGGICLTIGLLQTRKDSRII